MNAILIKTAAAWTDEETASLCALYLRMTDLEGRGLLGRSKSKGQTSKADLVREWIATVAPSRSKGSVESKLMNLSAVRAELGLPLVTGYQALSNMSASTRTIGAEVFTA